MAAYVVKDRDDGYYLRVGRWPRSAATVVAICTAQLASNFSNIMDYLQTLFGFFNAPLFATFILGMFWKRMTADRRLGRPRPPARWRPSLVAFLCEGTLGSLSIGVHPAQRPGRVVRGRRCGVRRRHRAQHRGLAGDQAQAGLRAARAGLLRDAQGGPASTTHEASYPWYRRTLPLAGVALAMVVVLNVAF